MKYRLPAEFEEHKSILLMFPYDGFDFPTKTSPVQWAFVEYIRKVAIYEHATVFVKDEKHQQKVLTMLKDSNVNLDNVRFVIYKAKRAWMRDSGPITVFDQNQKPIALDFCFNQWGNLYTVHKCDDNVPNIIAKYYNLPVVQPKINGKRVVLEGGAIDVNGSGTMIVTKECLMDQVDQPRNLGWTMEDYQNMFKEYFGITNTIWLEGGVTGDDTHGHVDDICRFVNKNTIVTCFEEDENDINYLPLKKNLEILENSLLEDGSKPNIIKLPMPKALWYQGYRLPASYGNFLITNKAILVPTYNDVNDRKALEILAKACPEREVVGINAVDIIWGFGSLHCLSHELYF